MSGKALSHLHVEFLVGFSKWYEKIMQLSGTGLNVISAGCFFFLSFFVCVSSYPKKEKIYIYLD
jgi:hypothetical protein